MVQKLLSPSAKKKKWKHTTAAPAPKDDAHVYRTSSPFEGLQRSVPDLRVAQNPSQVARGRQLDLQSVEQLESLSHEPNRRIPVQDSRSNRVEDLFDF